MKLRRLADSVLPIISSGHSAKFTANRQASSEGGNHPEASLESHLLCKKGKEGGKGYLPCPCIRSAWSGKGPALSRQLTMTRMAIGENHFLYGIPVKTSARLSFLQVPEDFSPDTAWE